MAGLGAARVLHSRQFNGEAGERTSSPVHAVIHCRHAAQCVQLLLCQRSQGIIHQFTYLAGHWTHELIYGDLHVPQLLTNHYYYYYRYYRFAAIMQDKLRKPEPPVKNKKILLQQRFYCRMSLLTATSTFGLGRRCQSSVHWWYLPVVSM